MEQFTVAGLLPALIALLPAGIMAVSLLWRGRVWSTREVPGAVFRLGIGALFAACVVPAWGLLAAQAAAWWWVRGYVVTSGGLLWPTASALMYLGLRAPQQAIDAGVVLALAMGVLQSCLAVSQWRKWPIFYVPGNICGTIGHRTGLGIYLGMLMSLAFYTSYGWWLVAAYLPGLVLARTSVGYAAAFTGLAWVHPHLWPLWLGAAIIGSIHRFLKWNGGKVKNRLFYDSLRTRGRVWVAALSKLRWPFWLIGRGADSFHVDSKQWVHNNKLEEHYKEAHNDYVEFLYEYGVCGVGAAVWFIYSIKAGLHLSDPATGALLGTLVASFGNFPVRVAPIVGLAALALLMVMR